MAQATEWFTMSVVHVGAYAAFNIMPLFSSRNRDVV